jgi:hypothetical protein
MRVLEHDPPRQDYEHDIGDVKREFVEPGNGRFRHKDALGDSAVRGDGKMEQVKLNVDSTPATVKTARTPGWHNEFKFHNSPASLIGHFRPYLSLELPLCA